MKKVGNILAILTTIVKFAGVAVIIFRTLEFLQKELKAHFGDELPESLRFEAPEPSKTVNNEQ